MTQIAEWIDVCIEDIKEKCEYIKNVWIIEKKWELYEQSIALENVPWWGKCEVKLRLKKIGSKYFLNNYCVNNSDLSLTPNIRGKFQGLWKNTETLSNFCMSLEKDILWLLYNVVKNTENMKKDIDILSFFPNKKGKFHVLSILDSKSEKLISEIKEYMKWKKCFSIVKWYYFS